MHNHDIAEAAAALLVAPVEEVSGQIVNIGSDDATVTVRTAAGIVAKLTGVGVEIEDNSPDKGDYRVAFNKLERILLDLTMRGVEEGIAELVDFVQERAEIFRSRPKEDFLRLALLRRQLETGQLDATLR